MQSIVATFKHGEKTISLTEKQYGFALESLRRLEKKSRIQHRDTAPKTKPQVINDFQEKVLAASDVGVTRADVCEMFPDLSESSVNGRLQAMKRKGLLLAEIFNGERGGHFAVYTRNPDYKPIIKPKVNKAQKRLLKDIEFEGGAKAGDLAKKYGIGLNCMSQRIAKLRKMGLVEAKDFGNGKPSIYWVAQ